MEKIDIGLKFKNAQVLNNKKNDAWLWIVATVIMVFGVALVVSCVCLLFKSYQDGNPLAAYVGGIGSGLGLLFAGITQFLVSIHRKRDSENKKYLAAEHDYTNFFIKNIESNEMVSIVLTKAIESCKIKMEYNNEKVMLSYDISKPKATLSDLCKSFISAIVMTIISKEDFREPLAAKYSFPVLIGKTYNFNAFLSCFDTEIKKTINSIEKMLQRKYFEFYDNDFFDYNMSNSLNKYVYVLLVYLLIITRGSNLYGNNNTIVELAPFTLYYFSKLGEKQ